MPIPQSVERRLDAMAPAPTPRKPAPVVRPDPILGGPKAPTGERRKGDPNPASPLPAWARARPHPTGSNPKRSNERIGVGHSIARAYPARLEAPPKPKPLPRRYRTGLLYNWGKAQLTRAAMENALPASKHSRSPRR